MDKNQKIEWTKERVMNMIDKWIEFECLYNPQHRLYHNKNSRNDALVRIVDSLKSSMPNVTVNDVKTKINYLRSQFCREVNKQKEIIRNAENIDDLESPTPYWYEKLSFLNRFVRVRRGRKDAEEYESMDESSLQLLGESIDGISFVGEPLDAKRLRLSDTQSLDQTTEVREYFIKSEPDITQYSMVNLAVVAESTEYPRQTNRTMDCSPNQTVAVNQAPAVPKQTSAATCTQLASCSNNLEYDAAFLNFIKVNLSLVTDVTLKDELTDKITMLLLEYKGKQRRLK